MSHEKNHSARNSKNEESKSLAYNEVGEIERIGERGDFLKYMSA
jgi:hypothetical protein